MKETSQERYRRRNNLSHSAQAKLAQERRKSEGLGSGKIYNTPRQTVFCNRCGEPCSMYPTGKMGHSKTICDNCSYEKSKTNCNFCATTESPQWRQWKGFHLCNACGIKVWRKRDSDFYRPMPGKGSANRASLTKKDIDGGLDLLNFLKDSGEL